MRFTPYPHEVENAMRRLFDSLNERDRRLYAAVEALKLGHGGILYLAKLLYISERTIRRGIFDLQMPDGVPTRRCRKKGGDVLG